MDEHDVGMPFTRISVYDNGEWAFYDIDYWTADIGLKKKNLPYDSSEIFILAQTGEVIPLFNLGGVVNVQSLNQYRMPPGSRTGYLTAINQIGDSWFAVGDAGQVYMRSLLAEDDWRLFDPQLIDVQRPPRQTDVLDLVRNLELLNDAEYMRRYTTEADENVTLTLQSICGDSLSNIYICGGRGNIRRSLIHSSGKFFQELSVFDRNEIKYTESLIHILMDSDERVWVCGHHGQILYGDHLSGFQHHTASGGQEHYYRMTSFRDRVFIAGTNDIYRIEDDTLTAISVNTPRVDVGAHFIESVDDVLWVVSPKDILRFDGSVWERVKYPSND